MTGEELAKKFEGEFDVIQQRITSNAVICNYPEDFLALWFLLRQIEYMVIQNKHNIEKLIMVEGHKLEEIFQEKPPKVINRIKIREEIQ